ncbi:MAG: hypothetical protein A3J75_00555 [Acidobacteria bacterium RBG_16_68_9]|nr:MAG: hypothetical protein A3J75_00555 [Acidobacteria bacterium RBG_16_68_9]
MARKLARGVCLAAVLYAVVAPVRGAADDVGMDILIGRMDRLWAQRETAEALHDLVALGMIALAIDPQSYEATWRLAQAYFWVAHTQPDRLFKKAMAAKASERAQQAVEIQPERVEGRYLYAVAVGEYASTIGIMKAVTEGVAGKIETAALKAYELDRDFDSGAPMMLLGRYYYMLPWPKRDLDRSRRYLEELKSRHPKVLTGRCYLAETYYAQGEKDQARAELDFVAQNGAQPCAQEALKR